MDDFGAVVDDCMPFFEEGKLEVVVVDELAFFVGTCCKLKAGAVKDKA